MKKQLVFCQLHTTGRKLQNAMILHLKKLAWIFSRTVYGMITYTSSVMLKLQVLMQVLLILYTNIREYSSIQLTSTNSSEHKYFQLLVSTENQRITAVRKIYQRGVVTPMLNIEQLWKDYIAYESSINPMIAEKMQQVCNTL